MSVHRQSYSAVVVILVLLFVFGLGSAGAASTDYSSHSRPCQSSGRDSSSDNEPTKLQLCVIGDDSTPITTSAGSTSDPVTVASSDSFLDLFLQPLLDTLELLTLPTPPVGQASTPINPLTTISDEPDPINGHAPR